MFLKRLTSCESYTLILHVQTLRKENIKYIKFNQFFNYWTHNKKDIKESPKLRVKAKATSWSWNTNDNFMTRYCRVCPFSEGGRNFEQHEKLVSNYELNFKNLFFVKFTIMEFLKLFCKNFVIFFRVFVLHKSLILIKA